MIDACPSPHQLLQLLAEELSRDESDVVADHVQVCQACQQSLDTLVGQARRGSPAGSGPSSAEDLDFLSGLKKQGPGYVVGGDERRSGIVPTCDAPLPATIGGYDILSRLGAGSTAVVYQAQDRQLGRVVALKVMQSNARPDVRARFRREAMAVARLQHPELVPVFEIGEHDGQLFLAMEFVDSGSLADYLHGMPQPPREAAAFVERIARAVAYAHQESIVHRDLKPANILLASRPQSSPAAADRHLPSARHLPLEAYQPKVADFGLAKCLDEDVDLTRSDALVGTPTYLAPEQLREPNSSGPSCDIYALGVLLYEMLCGRVPLVGPTILATLRLVAVAEPLPPRRLVPQVPRALETICLKCLAKDPDRRYATMLELAEDLRFFCEGRPIRARRVGWCERTWLWSRRNRLVAGLTASLVATLVAASCALLLMLIRVNRHAEEAVAHSRRADEHAYVSDMRMVQHAWDGHHFGRLRELLESHRPEHAGGIDRRGFEWYLWNQLGDLAECTLVGHTGWVNGVCYQPDGRSLASASDDGTLRIWTADTGSLLRTINAGSRMLDVCYSPDGRRLASASTNRVVQVWDAATGRSIAKLKGHTQWVSSLCFSPDGRRLASGSRDGTVRVWDPDAGTTVLILREHEDDVNMVRYSRDGKWLASASSDGTVKLWEASAGKLNKTLAHDPGEVKSLAFRPDGQQLASGLDDGTLTFWDLPSSKKLESLPAHTSGISSISYSPDGGQLVSASADRTIRIWDVATRREACLLQGHAEWISEACFSPDGQFLASSSHDGTIKIWNQHRERGMFKLPPCPGNVTGSCFSPDGKTLALAVGASAQLWTVPPQKPRHLLAADACIGCLKFNADGRLLAVGSEDGQIHVWSPQSERQTHAMTEPGPPIVDLCFAAEPQSLVSISRAGRAVVWRLEHDPPMQIQTHDIGPLAAACLGPGGRRVATVLEDGSLRVWDVATGKMLWRRKAHARPAVAVAFSPDGRLIVSGSADKTARIWDAESGQPRATLNGHSHTILAIAFSADGRRVVTAAKDKLFKLWNVDAGQELWSIKIASASPLSVAFGADGTYLVTSAGADVRLWHAPHISGE